MDFVYICRSGNNEELRYSIRSVVNSFPDANIWVVGGKPDWYSGKYIEVVQSANKYRNAIINLNAICESDEIADEFILMNDDFFILKKIKSIEMFHGGLLSDKIDKYIDISISSAYINKLILTMDRLKQKGIDIIFDYELHIPMKMEKQKLHHIINKYSNCLWRSMYGNIYAVGGKLTKDVKIYKDIKYATRSGKIDKDSIFLSTEDQSFHDIHKNILDKLFHKPSKYEL